ncbi:MAG: hypothetical protein IMY72_11170 [Bacteroidetes bacterium]|nr:hypothetical protein [Bacteroidota bacterium]
MKITGTRSHIRVEIEGKVILINGELTTTPAFYADIKSIKKWEPPYDQEEITEEEKTKLIQIITEESQKEGNIRVYFE